MSDRYDETSARAPERGLAEDFVFSQSSLQTYVDCKRRFWLAYIDRVPWPSPAASPAGEFEELMRLGATFHRLVQRAEEGVTSLESDDTHPFPLERWLQAYKEYRPEDLPTDHILCEPILESPIGSDGNVRRLMARYDLIAADDRRTVILDWKTGEKVTRPSVLQQKMQTSVYPFVAVEASQALPWGPITPEQVEMRYWFTAAPQQVVTFSYSASQHSANRNHLSALVSDILHGGDARDFPKVEDTPFARKYVCGFCKFRGLCDRGVEATDLAELDEAVPEDGGLVDAAMDFSLADVDELEF